MVLRAASPLCNEVTHAWQRHYWTGDHLQKAATATPWCQMLPKGLWVRGLVSRVTLLWGGGDISRQGWGKSLDNWGILSEGIMGLPSHHLHFSVIKGEFYPAMCFPPLSFRTPTWVLKEMRLPHHGLEPLKPRAKINFLSSCVISGILLWWGSFLTQTRSLCYRSNTLQDNKDYST